MATHSRGYPSIPPVECTTNEDTLVVMSKIVVQILLSVTVVTSAHAQGVSHPNVPDNIKAPEKESLVLTAHASGLQIYTCQQSSEGKYTWTLKGPEAELRDSRGILIGRHYAGPTWKHNDGSSVTGKPVARVDSPDANSVPWLLLSATGHEGNGALSRVSSIQRIETRGGQPPAAGDCDASKQGKDAKSPYTADYYFYSSKSRP